jgi:hypothetical protein
MNLVAFLLAPLVTSSLPPIERPEFWRGFNWSSVENSPFLQRAFWKASDSPPIGQFVFNKRAENYILFSLEGVLDYKTETSSLKKIPEISWHASIPGDACEAAKNRLMLAYGREKTFSSQTAFPIIEKAYFVIDEQSSQWILGNTVVFFSCSKTFTKNGSAIDKAASSTIDVRFRPAGALPNLMDSLYLSCTQNRELDGSTRALALLRIEVDRNNQYIKRPDKTLLSKLDSVAISDISISFQVDTKDIRGDYKISRQDGTLSAKMVFTDTRLGAANISGVCVPVKDLSPLF